MRGSVYYYMIQTHDLIYSFNSIMKKTDSYYLFLDVGGNRFIIIHIGMGGLIILMFLLKFESLQC
jgi:hypothetical protein